MTGRYLIEGPWIVFAVYWMIGALKTRRTAKEESFAARYGIMAFEIIGFVLIFDDDAGIGILGHRVFHHIPAIAIAGIVVLWAGIALALWARWHLGQYWSGRITIKEDHQLIRTGPYARLRHPIYSGLELAAIGSALALDRWRCVVGVCVIILGFWIKAKREEAMLSRNSVRIFRSTDGTRDFYFRASDRDNRNFAGKSLKNKRQTLAGLPLQIPKCEHLLHRIHTSAQPRFIARRGIPVQRTLLDRLVERRHRLAVGLFGRLLVSLFNGLAQGAQGCTQAGGVGAIGGSTLRGLTGALERRKMISHVWFVTFVCLTRCSGGRGIYDYMGVNHDRSNVCVVDQFEL